MPASKALGREARTLHCSAVVAEAPSTSPHSTFEQTEQFGTVVKDLERLHDSTGFGKAVVAVLQSLLRPKSSTYINFFFCVCVFSSDI